MTIITETDRLIIRLPTIDDAPDTFEIYGDPEVMKYVDDALPFDSIDVAVESIRRGLEHQQRHGICHWAVIEKTTGKLIGHCGFNVYESDPDPKTSPEGSTDPQSPPENRPEFENVSGGNSALELVFHFNRRYWGQGYATEAATACLEYAASHFPGRRIVALTLPENLASIRVLESLGLTFVRTVQTKGDILHRYEMIAS